MTPTALARLHAACFTTPRPWSAAEFDALASHPTVFLEYMDSGFAMGRVIADEAELLTLAVDPTQRRLGTGRKLMACFANTARQRGAICAFLEVAADNGAALALYSACGFSRAGLRKGYYSAPDARRIDAVIMNRTIP